MPKGKILLDNKKYYLIDDRNKNLQFELKREEYTNFDSIERNKIIDYELNNENKVKYIKIGFKEVKLKDIIYEKLKSENKEQKKDIPSVSFNTFFTSYYENLKKTNVDNFNLALNKFPILHDDKPTLFKSEHNNSKNIHIDINIEKKAKFDDKLIKEIIKEQEDYAKTLFKNTKKIEFKNEWRMNTGLGEASIYETSITLHHIYGIPYIPSSTIKGIVRSFIIQEVYENSEKKALDDIDFCSIFGSSSSVKVYENSKDKPKIVNTKYGDREGKITFFDAFPIDKINIKVDVMTPHNTKYYSDKAKVATERPSDFDNPVPIPFLTVENTSFQTYIGIKRNFDLTCYHIKKDTNSELLDIFSITDYWLKKVISEKGIGAKTSVGYGYQTIK